MRFRCLTYGTQSNPSKKVFTWFSPKVDACSKPISVSDESYGLTLNLNKVVEIRTPVGFQNGA